MVDLPQDLSEVGVELQIDADACTSVLLRALDSEWQELDSRVHGNDG